MGASAFIKNVFSQSSRPPASWPVGFARCRSPCDWRVREKKTGLALPHRPNLKRVREILVEFWSWDPPHRRKKVEQIIQKSAGLTRENCSRAPDHIFGPRQRRLRESSFPRAARPKSAHPRSRSQSPYPNEIDGAQRSLGLKAVAEFFHEHL